MMGQKEANGKVWSDGLGMEYFAVCSDYNTLEFCKSVKATLKCIVYDTLQTCNIRRFKVMTPPLPIERTSPILHPRMSCGALWVEPCE